MERPPVTSALEPGLTSVAPWGLTPVEQAAWVRRCVADAAALAEVVPHLVAGLADSRPERRGEALAWARGLCARAVLPAVLEAFEAAPERFLGVPDPWGRGGATLAVSLFAFVREARTRGEPRAEAFLRAALAFDELRVEAFYAIGATDGAALLPHLERLLSQRPDLAAALGTQYALRHRELALQAAERVAAAEAGPRAAFESALCRHLDRVHAVRLKVACRQALRSRPGP